MLLNHALLPTTAVSAPGPRQVEIGIPIAAPSVGLLYHPFPLPSAQLGQVPYLSVPFGPAAFSVAGLSSVPMPVRPSFAYRYPSPGQQYNPWGTVQPFAFQGSSPVAYNSTSARHGDLQLTNIEGNFLPQPSLQQPRHPPSHGIQSFVVTPANSKERDQQCLPAGLRYVFNSKSDTVKLDMQPAPLENAGTASALAVASADEHDIDMVSARTRTLRPRSSRAHQLSSTASASPRGIVEGTKHPNPSSNSKVGSIFYFLLHVEHAPILSTLKSSLPRDSHCCRKQLARTRR